jgi:hypothetical protein
VTNVSTRGSGPSYTVGATVPLSGGSYDTPATLIVDKVGLFENLSQTSAVVAASGSGYRQGVTSIRLVGGTFTTAGTVSPFNTTAVACTITQGGSNYRVNDLLRINEGNISGLASAGTIIVDTVSSGTVVAAHISSGGSYSGDSIPITTTNISTAGSGFGARFNVWYGVRRCSLQLGISGTYTVFRPILSLRLRAPQAQAFS